MKDNLTRPLTDRAFNQLLRTHDHACAMRDRARRRYDNYSGNDRKIERRLRDRYYAWNDRARDLSIRLDEQDALRRQSDRIVRSLTHSQGDRP